MKPGLLLISLVTLAAPSWSQEAVAPRDSVLWGEIAVGDPGVKVTDGAVARRKVSQFKAEAKKTKDKLTRAEALRKLGDWDHPEILKEAKKHLKSKNRFMAVEAAIVVARQSDKKTAGFKLLGALKNERRHDVICAQLVALGTVGNEKGFKAARKWLHYKTDEPRNELRKAAARYFGLIKAKAAFKDLATYLDDPVKRNTLDVDDPNNPPPAVWKKRWEAWEAYFPYVRDAMKAIADGETFETTTEAREWAKTGDAKKIGIKW